MDLTIEETPDILSHKQLMKKPNDLIEIYKGDFILKFSNTSSLVTGTIFIIWIPTLYAKFKGLSIDTINHFNVFNDKNIELIIDEISIGQVFITSIKNTNQQNIHIEGRFKDQNGVLHNKNINVDTIRFYIPNFIELNGSNIKKKIKKGVYNYSTRLRLVNSKYEISIDKILDYSKNANLLKEAGGYIFQYVGELKRSRGLITYSEQFNIIECLSLFLTFINGRRTSPILLDGFKGGEVKWRDFSSKLIDPYKYVVTWATMISSEQIEVAWNKFYEIWYSSEDDKEFLMLLINWYIESNKNSGLIEGAIVLGHNGLELFYNWYVVERNRIIVGKNAKDISASNKIRLLLNCFNIDYAIPLKYKELDELKKIFRLDATVFDGPEVIVQIRNGIVHSNESKRKELKKVTSLAKLQARELILNYIEIVLLKLIKYQGKYYDRTKHKLVDL